MYKHIYIYIYIYRGIWLLKIPAGDSCFAGLRRGPEGMRALDFSDEDDQKKICIYIYIYIYIYVYTYIHICVHILMYDTISL